MNRYTVEDPPLRLMSCVTTALGFMPHVLFLLIVVLSHGKEAALIFLPFTFMARLLGEYLFWFSMFPNAMDSFSTSDWRASVKEIVFDHTNSHLAIACTLVDLFVDGILIRLTMELGVSVALICLVYSGFQMLGALASYIPLRMGYIRQKLGFIISLFIGMLAIMVASNISEVAQFVFRSGAFKNIQMSTEALVMLLIIALKSCLSMIPVLSKWSIALLIKLKQKGRLN